jgi:hypothetical protein
MVAAMPLLDPRARLEKFVLRARKVLEHSLIREYMDLMNELASGTIRVRVLFNRQTGESEPRMRMELPPEEAFESFAARLRPFTMRDEPIYWEVVIDALEKSLSKDTLADLVDIGGLRDHWSNVLQGVKSTQAFYMQTKNGTMTDVQLASLWLNSDFLHAKPIHSAIGQDMTLDKRYQAAAGFYARLGACVQSTYRLVKHSVAEGLLRLDPAVFTERVVVETTIDIPGQIYSAKLGTELPSDLSNLDPKVWRPIHEDIELLDPEDGSPGDPEA